MIITVGPPSGCWQCVIWYRVGKAKCLGCGGAFEGWESLDSNTHERISPGVALMREVAGDPPRGYQKKPRASGPTNIIRGMEWTQK